jgi:hypothetical protein
LHFTHTAQVTKIISRRKSTFLILLLPKGPGAVIGNITFACLRVIGRRRRSGVCTAEIPLATRIPTVSPATKPKTTPGLFGGGAAEVEI